MSLKWTKAEDDMLRFMIGVGMNSKQIYENFSMNFHNRSKSAIQQRMEYLGCSPEDRKAADALSFDNADMLEKAIKESADRICNRLDNIARDLVHLVALKERQLDENPLEPITGLLEDLKTGSENQEESTEDIKRILNSFRREKRNGF